MLLIDKKSEDVGVIARDKDYFNLFIQKNTKYRRCTYIYIILLYRRKETYTKLSITFKEYKSKNVYLILESVLFHLNT